MNDRRVADQDDVVMTLVQLPVGLLAGLSD